MELNDVINAYPHLTTLSKESELPTAMKYKLFSILDEIEPAIRFFESQRKELVERFSAKDENGNTYIPPENIEEFMSKADELGSTEVDYSISKGKFNLSIEVPLSAADLRTLKPFFDFVEE